MWRAVALGVAAGMRTQVPAAVLAWRQARGQLPFPSRLLRRRGTVGLATASALGELLVDKAPITPSRLESGPLFGRVGMGAVAGSAVASAFGRSRVAGAAWGAGGALLGSVGGYRFRMAASQATGVSDTAWALVEDAVAITLALLATRSTAAAH